LMKAQADSEAGIMESLKMMKKYDLVMDASLFLGILEEYVKIGCPEKGIQVYQRIRRERTVMNKVHDFRNRYLILWRTYLMHFVICSNWSDLKLTFGTIRKDFKLEVGFYNLVISALLETEDPDGAKEVLTSMEEDGLQPNEETYRLFAISSNSKLKAEVVSLVRQMDQHTHKESSQGIRLLLNSALDHDTNGLVEVLQEKDYFASTWTWNEIISGMMKKGNVAEAIQLFGKINKKGETSNYTYFAMIRGYLQNGQTLEAAHFFQNLINSGMVGKDQIFIMKVVMLLVENGQVDMDTIFDLVDKHLGVDLKLYERAMQTAAQKEDEEMYNKIQKRFWLHLRKQDDPDEEGGDEEE